MKKNSLWQIMNCQVKDYRKYQGHTLSINDAEEGRGNGRKKELL